MEEKGANQSRRQPAHLPLPRTPPLLSRLLPGMIASGALLELSWALWLGLHLPVQYVSTNWNAAWAGFDTVEVLALLATAWSAWYEKAELTLFSGLAATLILVDAWFDVTTNHSGGVNSSVLFLTLEVPVAAVLYWVCIHTFRKLKRAAPENVPGDQERSPRP